VIEIAADPDPPGIAHVLPSYRGELAFDVGANVGQSAETLCRRFQRVVSIEPAIESFEVLERRSRSWPNVTVVHAACAAEPGEMTLSVQERHIAKGQLSAYKETASEHDVVHGWGQLIEHRTVPAVTVDGLMAEFGQPTLIKVDVEGNEVHVIRGAAEALRRLPSLYIEVHDKTLGDELEEILRPLYDRRLEVLRHPHYRPNDWGWANHYWLIAGSGSCMRP